MRYLLLSLLLVTTTLPGQGIGLHPPEVDWQQLNSDYVRIIFPAGYERQARRAASMIDVLATEHNRSIGEQLYDFDLVLQTPNMTVNGYVGLAPFRSEFYVTPPQSFSLLSNAGWVDLLTIHEFRHVQQNSNERRGITKLLSYLQGQQGWAAAAGLATPNWFSEGDAVIAETALTPSGRGRTPAFSAELRALLRQNVIYRYAKARNGSFRHLVPDHYRYGYAMLTYARARFGNDVWKPVLQQGAAYRGILYPFSRALRRQTGLTTRDLYYTTLADLEAQQDTVLALRRPLVAGEEITGTDRRDIRDYRFPFLDREGRLLALRTSYRTLPALVMVGPSGDSIITPIGVQREPWLDGSRRFAVWTEYRQHPRYTNQNFSELVVYELATGRRRVLTDGGHYLSASLSADERQLVAVWYDPLAASPELHLFDVATGEVTARRSVPATSIAWPRFSADGRRVYFLGQTVGGVAIQAWEVGSTDEVSILRPRNVAPIDMLNVTEEGDLLYVGGQSGTDNVYRLDPGTGEEEQLTDVAIGAYYPLLTGDRLYYSSPTPRGERLHLLELEDEGSRLVVQRPAAPKFFERPAAFAAELRNLPAEVEERAYPITDFSNTLGGVKLHSWSFNGSYVTPGLSIEFANALNTVALSLDGLYNINEDRYSGGATFTYGGLFPVIELAGQYRDRNTIVQSTRTDSLRFFRQEFSELSLGPEVSVPLRWVVGNQFTSLTPSVGLQYYRLRDAESGTLPQNFANLSLGTRFSSLQRTAVRQVQPRLGATARLQYDRALGDARSGARLLWQSSAYLPGLFATHGLRLDFDLQREQSENTYQYVDVFRYARGYDQPLNDRVYRIGVNYQLPLLYPDLGLLGITYFKRLRLLGFYDYSRYAIDAFEGLEFTNSSVGAQVYFDNVWFNAATIPLGVELAYRLDRDVFSTDERDLQIRLLVSGSF